MGRVKSSQDPLRAMLTPLASAVMLLVLTGWVGMAHKPETGVLSGALVVPAIREALRMIVFIPSELHQDFLNSLGSTLFTLVLAGSGTLVMVLKTNTRIRSEKLRVFTLAACLATLCMQLVLYANQAGAGLQAILMVTLGLLCCANQCPVVRTTTILSAIVGWLAWAGTSALL